MAFDRLIKRIDELHNPSVAGLDPRLEYVPQFIQDASFVKLGHTLEAAADGYTRVKQLFFPMVPKLLQFPVPMAAVMSLPQHWDTGS